MKKALALFLSVLLASAAAHAQSPVLSVDEDRMPGDVLSIDKAPQSWILNASANWMGRIPDDVKLRRINIPGTHDSGARFGPPGCPTQTWTIAQQLQAGIRFLDIRARRVGTEFAIHHADCYQNMNFADVMEQVAGFLTIQPSETVFMSVQEEVTDNTKAMPGSESFSAIWKRYMQAKTKFDPSRTYGSFFSDTTDVTASLGSVRKKVVLINNAGIKNDGNQDIGISMAALDVQNAYKVYYVANDTPFGEGTVSLGQKIRMANAQIDKAYNSLNMVLNFISGSTGMTPFDVAKSLNASTYTKLGPYVGNRKIGIIAMDFPGERLIYRIIKNNFGEIGTASVCKAQQARGDSEHSYAVVSLPESKVGTQITIREGAYNHYVFPKCNRVTWTDLTFSCGNDGRWFGSGKFDADAYCTNANTEQRYLSVGDK